MIRSVTPASRINLVAFTWGWRPKPGDAIADAARPPQQLVPWQQVAGETGAELR